LALAKVWPGEASAKTAKTATHAMMTPASGAAASVRIARRGFGDPLRGGPDPPRADQAGTAQLAQQAHRHVLADRPERMSAWSLRSSGISVMPRFAALLAATIRRLRAGWLTGPIGHNSAQRLDRIENYWGIFEHWG
jgi:hypothetical protein